MSVPSMGDVPFWIVWIGCCGFYGVRAATPQSRMRSNPVSVSWGYDRCHLSLYCLSRRLKSSGGRII